MEIPQNYTADPLEFAFKLEQIYDPSSPMLIHNITVIEKLSIYGYQTQKTRFFKLEVYNAEHIKKLAELSLEGFDGFHFQPYEAHIDTFQHFYSEYCLSGIDWMNINNITYRSGCSSIYLPKSNYQKFTKSDIEGDCLCYDITKKSKYIGSEFGTITLPPVYRIWKVKST